MDYLMPLTLTPAVRLKSRKGRATRACVKVNIGICSQYAELVGQGVHGESWIAQTLVNRSKLVGCGEEGTETPYQGASGDVSWTPGDHHPWRPTYQVGHGTNGAPTHTASPLAENVGSPTQEESPAWQRSFRITQGGPVIGSADGKSRNPKTPLLPTGVTAIVGQTRSHTQPVQGYANMPYRHGYKTPVMAVESPAVWEEGKQLTQSRLTSKVGLC